MLAFKSSSDVGLAFRAEACDAAETRCAPGPKMPPTRAQATRKRGTKRKYRRWDDNPTSRVCFQYRRLAQVRAVFSRRDVSWQPVSAGRRPLRYGWAFLLLHPASGPGRLRKQGT